MTAAPAPGYNFLGWSGTSAWLDNPIAVDMSASKTLTATFGKAFNPTTYLNPVLPGDHPDMNIYREGDDFYLVGSNFHRMPSFEILRSTDLVRWERVTRVVHSSGAGQPEGTHRECDEGYVIPLGARACCPALLCTVTPPSHGINSRELER